MFTWEKVASPCIAEHCGCETVMGESAMFDDDDDDNDDDDEGDDDDDDDQPTNQPT